MALTPAVKMLLVYLYDQKNAGADWVKLGPNFPGNHRQKVLRLGLVEMNGKRRSRASTYRISEAGIRALEDAGGIVNHTVSKPQAATTNSNGHALGVRPFAAGQRQEVPDAAIKPAVVCPPCSAQSCVHRQALDILIQRIPEARDLLAVLEKLNHR